MFALRRADATVPASTSQSISEATSFPPYDKRLRSPLEEYQVCALCSLTKGRAASIIHRSGAEHEKVLGQSGDDFLRGLRGDDTLMGRRGDDYVAGGEGDDRLNGGAGDDAVRGGDGNDTILGGRGDDTVTGGRGDDVLNSGAGDDVLRAGDGDDIVRGGAGDDRMFGGEGADRFVIKESDWAQGPTRDVIRDFEAEDLIDLSAATENDLTFVGEGSFSGAGGEVRVEYAANGNAMITVDVDGDMSVDATIVLFRTNEVTADDFVLQV